MMLLRLMTTSPSTSPSTSPAPPASPLGGFPCLRMVMPKPTARIPVKVIPVHNALSGATSDPEDCCSVEGCSCLTEHCECTTEDSTEHRLVVELTGVATKFQFLVWLHVALIVQEFEAKLESMPYVDPLSPRRQGDPVVAQTGACALEDVQAMVGALTRRPYSVLEAVFEFSPV